MEDRQKATPPRQKIESENSTTPQRMAPQPRITNQIVSLRLAGEKVPHAEDPWS